MVTASRDVLQMFYSEAKVQAGSMVNPGGAVPKTKTRMNEGRSSALAASSSFNS
jgi:hypothetical protein